MMASDDPLIVTAHLDEASFAVLDRLRGRYFPVERNIVPAHISLFHHLPGAELRSVLETVEALCDALEPLDLHPRPPRFLGRGVALAYEHDRLNGLHAAMARAWAAWLTPQDKQPFKAHVTIQNKVGGDEARSLLEAMQAAAAPPCRVTGIDVWHYRGGPWQLVRTCPFGTIRPGWDGVVQ